MHLVALNIYKQKVKLDWNWRRNCEKLSWSTLYIHTIEMLKLENGWSYSDICHRSVFYGPWSTSEPIFSENRKIDLFWQNRITSGGGDHDARLLTWQKWTRTQHPCSLDRRYDGDDILRMAARACSHGAIKIPPGLCQQTLLIRMIRTRPRILCRRASFSIDGFQLFQDELDRITGDNWKRLGRYERIKRSQSCTNRTLSTDNFSWHHRNHRDATILLLPANKNS